MTRSLEQQRAGMRNYLKMCLLGPLKLLNKIPAKFLTTEEYNIIADINTSRNKRII